MLIPAVYSVMPGKQCQQEDLALLQGTPAQPRLAGSRLSSACSSQTPGRKAGLPLQLLQEPISANVLHNQKPSPATLYTHAQPQPQTHMLHHGAPLHSPMACGVSARMPPLPPPAPARPLCSTRGAAAWSRPALPAVAPR